MKMLHIVQKLRCKDIEPNGTQWQTTKSFIADSDAYTKHKLKVRDSDY